MAGGTGPGEDGGRHSLGLILLMVANRLCLVFIEKEMAGLKELEAEGTLGTTDVVMQDGASG